MQRKGSAIWQDDLKSGKGTVSTDSGVLSQMQYSFATRFENGKGTNPEELIAAAHAGCFTMALSAQLGTAGLTPEKLETTATIRSPPGKQGGPSLFQPLPKKETPKKLEPATTLFPLPSLPRRSGWGSAHKPFLASRT